MASADLLDFHSFCITDTGTRLDQYARAIAACVHPGAVVADVGTGTGLLAFLACRAGAKRVYAIEESDAIALGRQLAASAGFLDRIEFINIPSTRVMLPETVDVIVGDIHDSFGLQARGLGAWLDARDRFLKPGGVLIPQTIELYVAAVEAASHYAKAVDTWRTRVAGLDLSPLRPVAVNQEHAGRFEASQLLFAPTSIETMTLDTVTTLHAGGSVKAAAARDGTMHGVCGCFVSTLTKGVSIGNLPGDTGTSNFAQAFFPIEAPAAVSKGDEITITVDRFDGLDTRWQVEIARLADGSRKRFEHTSLQALPASIETLRKQAHSYQPMLNRQGQMERALLERLDGTHSVADLARWLGQEFKEELPSEREAEAFLKSTIARCG